MSEPARFYPTEANLGKECRFWSIEDSIGCHYQKAEMLGRLSCEGIIDDICLYLKDGRPPASMTAIELIELKNRLAESGDKSIIPPGSTAKPERRRPRDL